MRFSFQCYLRTKIKSNSSPRNNINVSSVTSTPITIVKSPQSIGLPPCKSPSINGQMTNGTKQHQKPSGTILPIPSPAHSLSMSDVSDMLFEFYKANTAKTPKNNNKIIDKVTIQTSPTSVDSGNTQEIVTSTPTITITPTKIEKNSINDNTSEPHSTTITSTAININNTASKNVNGDEMVATAIQSINNSTPIQAIVKEFGKKLNASFHPRIKYSSINNKSSPSPNVILAPAQAASTTIIPSSLGGGTTTIQPVLTSTCTASTTSSSSPPKTQPPVVVIPSSVIQSPILSTQPAAAVLAAALFRDGYQNFHQQIRAQEQLLKQQRQQQDQQINSAGIKNESQQQQRDRIENSSGPQPQFPPKYMQNFLRKDNRYSDENEQQSSSDEEEEDDDNGKYPEIDDIHLIEGAKSTFNAANQMSLSMDADYMSDESHKYSMIAAHALRNLEYSLSDYGGGRGGDGSIGHIGPNGEIESMYNCRHCGKKYRWKSTLRRHENVECGGKEPSHQCPYCPYKSKQRGNLGVHVRKHHANLPQLASKRRSKYSQPRD